MDSEVIQSQKRQSLSNMGLRDASASKKSCSVFALSCKIGSGGLLLKGWRIVPLIFLNQNWSGKAVVSNWHKIQWPALGRSTWWEKIHLLFLPYFMFNRAVGVTWYEIFHQNPLVCQKKWWLVFHLKKKPQLVNKKIASGLIFHLKAKEPRKIIRQNPSAAFPPSAKKHLD